MTAPAFVAKYKPAADAVLIPGGVPVIVGLAQAGIESGWGKHAPGLNFFGIKAGKSWTGKRQLLQTTEFHKTDTYPFEHIISISPTPSGKFRYVIKDWFRAYDSAEGSFTDYAALLRRVYSKAFDFASEPERFAEEVCKRYATDPNYFSKVRATMQLVENLIAKQEAK